MSMQPQPLKKPLLPNCPGAYLFWSGKKPLYIGKAGNLKKRLASYWRENAGQKTKLLLYESDRFEFQKTDSEIEALILEARLIKQHRPKYNVLMRDDKNYFYVGIAGKPYPRIFITHQPIKNQKTKNKSQNDPEQIVAQFNGVSNFKFKINYFGPYTSGTALKTTLRLLRKIFPYCTCKKPHMRPCLNAEIGRCFGFCCGKNQMQKSKIKNQNLGKIYDASIKKIIAVLTGEKQKLLGSLKKEMRVASQKQQYEVAAKLRNQIAGLENIFSHRFLLEQSERKKSAWPRLRQKLQKLFTTQNSFERIEAYDISNISGVDATGSMIVFRKGAPDKKEYRKFKIKTVRGANDVAMMQEVVRRRMRHPEWQFPNTIVVDGGKPQLNAALSQLKTDNLQPKTTVAALAKKEEELYIENKATLLPLKTLNRDILHLFQAVRDEAHRFAKKYHHKLREMKIKSE